MEKSREKIINYVVAILFVIACMGAGIFGSITLSALGVEDYGDSIVYSVRNHSDVSNSLISKIESERDEVLNWWEVDKIFQNSVQITIVCIILACVFAIAVIVFTGKKDQLKWYDKIFSDIQVGAAILVGCVAVPAVMLIETGYGYGYLVGAIHKFDKMWEKYECSGQIQVFGYLSEDLSEVLTPQFMIGLGIVMGLAVTLFELYVIMSLTVKAKDGSLFKRTLLGAIIISLLDAFRNNSKTKFKWMLISFVAVFVTAFWSFISLASDSPVGILLVTIAWCAVILIFEPKFFDRYEEIKDGLKKLSDGDVDNRIRRTLDNSELDSLAADINSISDSVKNAVEKELKNERMKSALISNVSHDLKTPLTSMVSYVDLLKKEGLDSKNAPEYLKILDEKTNRLKDLTLDLFDAAKASSGDMPVEMQDIDLGLIVNQEVAEFEDVLKDKNIEVIISEEESHIMARADGRHLSRVLDNLLNNIKKYALEGSRVYIDVTKDKTISVKNVSRDRLNISETELMERFTRGDESRNTEGSGLGLAIARDLTSLMGGTFSIKIDGDLFRADIQLEKTAVGA